MTTRDALDAAMRRDSVDEAMRTLIERGVWMTDADSMTQAIHQVYCGIMADHEGPNDKDRAQAQAMIDALRKHATASTEA